MIRFKHHKVMLWTIAITFVTLFISFIIMNDSWSAFFQNISAGLISGIIVALIANYKSQELKQVEIEREFLEPIKTLYLQSRNAYLFYRKCRKSDQGDYEEALYDLMCELNSLENYLKTSDNNIRITSIMGGKPSEMLDQDKEYNYLDQEERHKKLYDLYNSTANWDEDIREQADLLIGEIQRNHRILLRSVHNRITDLNKKKTDIELSVP